jgi:hypothetical protein
MERGVSSTWQYVAPKIASSRRAKSRMEGLGKPRHGREGWRLSEREVSESHPVKLPWVATRDSSAPLGMTIAFCGNLRHDKSFYDGTRNARFHGEAWRHRIER